MVSKAISAVILVGVVFFGGATFKSYAEQVAQSEKIDVIITTSRSSKLDVRGNYTHEVLTKALELSSDKYGAFKIETIPVSITNDVMFYELSRGNQINLVMSGATSDKDYLATAIRIPIRRGILNYRLLVINKKNRQLFENVSNLSQLKPFSVGIHAKAVTSEILKVLGFSVVEGASYDGMFKQLAQNRFDYIPRGIHEAYDEVELRKDSLSNLIIEPNLALYMPMPYYIYVSPRYPRLAERLTYGLEKMIAKGMIKKIFERYYAEDIKRANLAERTIINVGNPFLSPKTPLDRKELWIDDLATTSH